MEFFIDIMDEDPRAMMFVILWAIWYTRNQHVFQNKRMKVQPLLSKMAFVPLSREDITMAQESNLIPTYGKTPPLGIFKINFDAAMRKEVGTRLGFIVHDSEGLVLAPASMLIQSMFGPREAEAFTFQWSIIKAAELLLSDACYEIDCL